MQHRELTVDFKITFVFACHVQLAIGSGLFCVHLIEVVVLLY